MNSFLLPIITVLVCCSAAMMVLSIPLEGTPCDVRPTCNKTDCSGAFEEYRCCYGCYEPTCAVPEQNIQCFACNDGCVCKDGYIRSCDKGPCIPKQQCP
ncbi:AAEL005487-PA [Aedes aegypti]|uniref:AAEL005487-PA n=1 Tax=Aedes aegypti TaxID=7159 RepID=Q179W5_AEDAE|nr:AAEL005487-PA [Aedes aegypti]